LILLRILKVPNMILHISNRVYVLVHQADLVLLINELSAHVRLHAQRICLLLIRLKKILRRLVKAHSLL